MELYSLTPKGRALARSVRGNKSNPEWGVIYFLARNGGSATDEQIKTFVPNTNRMLLAKMCSEKKGYLTRSG